MSWPTRTSQDPRRASAARIGTLAETPTLTTRTVGVTVVDPAGDAKSGIPTQKKVGAPLLEMLVWNDGTKDRVVAIFSPFDISCALESRGANQCRGYVSQDAAKIGVNMILYALLQ